MTKKGLREQAKRTPDCQKVAKRVQTLQCTRPLIGLLCPFAKSRVYPPFSVKKGHFSGPKNRKKPWSEPNILDFFNFLHFLDPFGTPQKAISDPQKGSLFGPKTLFLSISDPILDEKVTLFRLALAPKCLNLRTQYDANEPAP